MQIENNPTPHGAGVKTGPIFSVAPPPLLRTLAPGCMFTASPSAVIQENRCKTPVALLAPPPD